MSVHLIANDDQRPLRERFGTDLHGEIFSIKLDFDPWIHDSARVAIETTIDSWFIAWLKFYLSGPRGRAIEVFGKKDYADFSTARDNALRAITENPAFRSNLLLNFGTRIQLEIAPSLLLVDAQSGSWISKKATAIVLWVSLAVADALVGVVVGHYSEPYLFQPKQAVAVSTSVVCTSRSVGSFVNSMNQQHDRIETLAPNEIDQTVTAEARQLYETLANQPHASCQVTVTASVDGKTKSSFTLSQREARATLDRIEKNKKDGRTS
jgi:hypothetical protein